MYLCHGCGAHMKAIFNNEGNLACPQCNSEFVEEIEQTTPTTTTTSDPMNISNTPTNLLDDDIFSRAFDTAVSQSPPTRNTPTSASYSFSSSSSSSTGGAPRQTITFTTIGQDGQPRTITRTSTGGNAFNPAGLEGFTNDLFGFPFGRPSPQANRNTPTGSTQTQTGQQPMDIFQMVNQMMNNAQQRYQNQDRTGQPNARTPSMFSFNFGGPNNDIFSNFMQHIGQPLGGGFGTTLGDYVFSDNLDDIITRMMEANIGRGGTPPASQNVLSKLKHRQATATDCKDCAVCQDQIKEEENIIELPCGHLFHKDCLVPWLERHANCPVCRSEIGEDGSALPPHSYQHQQQ